MIKITSEKFTAQPLLSGEKGFTLIESVISIVLLSFMLFSLIKVFSDISMVSVQPEFQNVQAMLAQELIEEIRSKKFDELSTKDANGNWSSALGVESGETAGTKSTYDDVDDYNGFSETLSSPHAGFVRSVTVAYVDGSDLNTGLAIPTPIGTNWTPEFKKVTVTVTHSASGSLSLETIVSSVST